MVFIVTVLTSALVLIGSAGYAQELGQPQPFSEKGQITVGLGYYYYQSEWESDDPNMEPGSVMQNYIHAVLSYGLVEDWECYIMVGVADQVAEEAFPFDTPADLEDGFKPNAAVGFRGLLYKTPTFGLGPIFHAGIYSSYEDEKEGTITVPGVGPIPATIAQKSADTWDVNVGLGLQYDLEKVLIYGAPFYYMAKARGEGTITTPAGVEEISAEGEEKNNVGGLVGVTFPLAEGIKVNFEGQYKSDVSFSAFVSKSFSLGK
jgi:hypothetical protein